MARDVSFGVYSKYLQRERMKCLLIKFAAHVNSFTSNTIFKQALWIMTDNSFSARIIDEAVLEGESYYIDFMAVIRLHLVPT